MGANQFGGPKNQLRELGQERETESRAALASHSGHEPFSLLVFVLHVVPTFFV